MRNLSTMMLAVLGILSLNSCGENKSEKDTPEPMQNDSRSAEELNTSGNLDDGENTAKPEFKNEDLAAVYEDYAALKSALVNSDASEAKREAEAIVEKLEKSEEITEELPSAQKIAQTEDLDVQRTAFSDLSAEVEKLLNDNLVSGKIYKLYCPMAFEGAGGYWLSSSEEIRNPYYGDKMLKCGSVRDTLQ